MDTYIDTVSTHLLTAVRAALHGGSTFSVLFPREVSLVTQASETRSPYLLLRVSRVYDIDSILSIRSQELQCILYTSLAPIILYRPPKHPHTTRRTRATTHPTTCLRCHRSFPVHRALPWVPAFRRPAYPARPRPRNCNISTSRYSRKRLT
jgi:hypothetical protein